MWYSAVQFLHESVSIAPSVAIWLTVLCVQHADIIGVNESVSPQGERTADTGAHHSNESGVGSWGSERLLQLDTVLTPKELQGQSVARHQHYACRQHRPTDAIGFP